MIALSKNKTAFAERNAVRIRRRKDTMKKVTLALSVLFIILTFAGAGYVLFNGGRVNAGYAVVPMIFALISIVAYHNRK